MLARPIAALHRWAESGWAGTARPLLPVAGTAAGEGFGAGACQLAAGVMVITSGARWTGGKTRMAPPVTPTRAELPTARARTTKEYSPGRVSPVAGGCSWMRIAALSPG